MSTRSAHANSNSSSSASAADVDKKRRQTLDKLRANHLSRQLQLRLQYARLKVDHGWQKQNLNEVENLYFRHSQLRSQTQRPGPYPNADTALLYPGSVTSPHQPQQQQQQQTSSRITGTSSSAGTSGKPEKGNSSFYLKLTPPQNPNAMIDPALLQNDLIQMDVDGDDDVYSTGPLQSGSGKGKGKAKAKPKTKSNGNGNGQSKSASPMVLEDDDPYDPNNVARNGKGTGTGTRTGNSTVHHHSDTAAALNAAFANNSNSNSNPNPNPDSASNTHANLNYNYNYTPAPAPAPAPTSTSNSHANSMPPPPPPIKHKSDWYTNGDLYGNSSFKMPPEIDLREHNRRSSSSIYSGRHFRAPRRRKSAAIQRASADLHKSQSDLAPPSADAGKGNKEREAEASGSSTGADVADVVEVSKQNRIQNQALLRSIGAGAGVGMGMGGSTYDSFWSAHAPVGSVQHQAQTQGRVYDVGEGSGGGGGGAGGEWQNNDEAGAVPSGMVVGAK